MAFCSNCGAQNDNEALNCQNCGASLGGASVPPAEQPPAQPQYNYQPQQPPPSPPPQYGYQPQQPPTPPQYGYTGGPVQPGVPGAEEPKKKIVAALLSFLLGSFGVGRFYLGYTTFGIIQCAITLVSCGTCGWIWGIVDGIMILTGNIAADAKGVPLVD